MQRHNSSPPPHRVDGHDKKSPQGCHFSAGLTVFRAHRTRPARGGGGTQPDKATDSPTKEVSTIQIIGYGGSIPAERTLTQFSKLCPTGFSV